MNWQKIIFDFFTYGILIYSVILLSFYLLIGVYSAREIKKYFRKNSFADFRVLASSEYLPGISIIAPAYNEAANIVENVRSMLSIHYNALELIIINDGSKDDSLDRLIRAYGLYKTNIFINEQLPTRKVRGVYKSKNPVYNKLIVVDKENGGKADALNAGINVSRYGYFVCVDVDCILEQDALLKMIKPFVEVTRTRVIASGGVIRVANDCKIENGRLTEVKLPKQFLSRMQVLEYIRAFLLGRMAWSRLNGLLLISGAFGAFDKEIVIKCGGYSINTVGEDMELIVRMRRYMEEQKVPYKVTFIPDPLCWTEVPYNYKILGRQRNRWARGTIETLRAHKKMFLNPRYHIIGMVSYPYWFFFEFLAPVVEFLGIVGFIIFAILGLIQWKLFLILLACILSFGFLFSLFGILMEVITFNQYKNRKDFLKLVGTAFLEPFLFHPFVVWSAIKGNIDYYKKKNGWGEMTRIGLGASQENVSNTTGTQTLEGPAAQVKTFLDVPTEKQPSKFISGLRESVVYSLILLGAMFLVKIYGLIRDWRHFGVPDQFARVIEFGLINDVSFVLNYLVFPCGIFIFIYLVNRRIARVFFTSFSILVIFVHAALGEYFLQTLVPLGADLFGYSMADIRETIGNAGIPMPFVISIILIIGILVWLFIFLPKRIKINLNTSIAIFGLYLMCTAFSVASVTSKWKPGPDFSNSIALNKSWFFYKNCYHILFGSHNVRLNPGELAADKSFHYVDEKHYPFLHTVDSTDVLAPFFNKSETRPNFVFVVVEGLGRAFSNQDAYLGSFTPFLDSLSQHSLYWSNFLSEGGRTFAMLPSIFGSLPFGKNGFLELGNQMPPHESLLSILRKSGYSTNFFYGGDASFDNMGLFVKMDGGNVYDEKTFGSSYSKMPLSNNGFSWGYGDADVLRKCSLVSSEINGPFCDVIMTLSTHSPFLINNQGKYLQMFEQRMNDLHFTESEKEEHRRFQNQYATILYADESIRNFVTTWSTRPDFQNTIFVITGDHRMPEIPMSTKIDRYHVPLIIYSPLLKRSQRFKAVSTHFDITPSILAFLRDQYLFKVPSLADWIGSGLDTCHNFRNIHSYPLMQTKNTITDYISGEYMLHNEDLFKISNNMGLDPIENDSEMKKLQNGFAIFMAKNQTVRDGVKLLPDSLLNQ